MVYPIKNYRDQVGALKGEPVYKEFKYVALLADGTTKDFAKHEDAKKVSKLIQAVVTNEAEYIEYWENSRILENKTFALWYDGLRKDYDHLNDGLFGACYNKAYEDGHSSGYDEVANEMISVVDFAETIIMLYQTGN